MTDTVYGVNLVENGSFEDVAYSRGHGRHHNHRSNSNAELTGWHTSSGPGPDIETSDWWTRAADGHRYIELDGSGARDTNSSIYQNIPTGGTGTFELSFSYAAPPFSRGSSNGIEVIWNGQVIDTITSDGGWGTDWQTFTYELEGAGDMTRLEFRAVGRDDGRGGLLDDISVVGLEPPELFTDANDTVVLADDDPDYGSGEPYDALGGDDVVQGGDLDDEIFGNTGNDTLSGGAGNDILRGGADTKVQIEVEQTVEHDLSGLSSTPTLGIDPAHFRLQNDHKVTMTFVGEEAGYRNTVGYYKIAADGTIGDVQIVFQDASDGRWYGTETGTAVELDLSGGDNFGVFLIADGARRNNFDRYDNGHYEFRNHDGSPATVNSNEPELVFVDRWGRAKELKGEVYHSSVTTSNLQLNGDDTVHVKSSASDAGALRLSFEDLPSRWSDNDFDDVVIDLSFAPVTETVLVDADDNDVLYGEDGDDQLFGGAGRDALYGGTGNDTLDGGKGRDILDGGDGDDLLIGGGGRDVLKGGQGNDELKGGGGDDVLRGNAGDDILKGGGGDDQIFGGAGDDVIVGGKGADDIDGGNGDDVVRAKFADLQGDLIDGGKGTDKLKITVETDELQDASVVQDLIDLMNFVQANADASSNTGPSQTFAALGITVSNLEDVDIKVIDSETGEVVDGFFAPDISVTVAAAEGDEDTAIALDISASIGNATGSYDVSITVAGVPAGAVLSAGTDNNDGTWTLSEADLAGLTITPAPGSGADFSLTVTATATSQISGAETVSDPETLDVTVDAVVDTPTLSVADFTLADPDAGDQTINGTDGKDTLIGGGGNDIISGGNKGDVIIGDGASTATTLTGALSISALLGDLDGSEELTITVAGLPAGATLSAGNVTGPGTVELNQADLAGLTISVPVGASDFTLTVTATATDTDPDTGQQSSASTSAVAAATVIVSVDGDDILTGGKGADTIQGNGGNDIIFGDGGADDIDGGDGDDTIDGGAGNDIIFGGLGNDTISGGGGNDVILGGDGDDVISGDAGDDNLQGGNGNDVIDGKGGADVIDGGGGNDTLTGGGDNDTLIGGAGNDWLSGLGGDDVLQGGDGDDVLEGGGGQDQIFGGTGNDQLFGGNQADTLDGGDGNDIINGEGGGDTIFGGAGEDTISGGDGADVIDGGDGNDHLYGDDGNDEIHGGGLDDRLWGGLGKDTLFGDAGNDIIYGGDDNDEIHGGDDNDTLRGEAGNDLIFGDAGNDILIGAEGKDELHGGDGNDLLFGQEGGDTLFGDAGNDTLWGDGGSDELHGGSGNDRLEGHGGDDVMDGGIGVDFMIGGKGSDRFVFDLSAGDSGIGAGNRDTISDFEADGTDTIEFGGIASFSFMGDETQDFAGGGAASGRFNDALKVLEIDADGDQVVDMEIELLGVLGSDLDDSDFTVS